MTGKRQSFDTQTSIFAAIGMTSSESAPAAYARVADAEDAFDEKLEQLDIESYSRRSKPNSGPSMYSGGFRRAGRLLYARYRKLPLLLQLLPALLLPCIFMGLLGWYTSDRRLQEIAIIRMSCGVPPSIPYFLMPEWWKRYRGETRRQAYFTEDEWSLPARLYPQSAATPKVSILQVCDNPYRQSTELVQLLRNHRSYAQRWGAEYVLYTGESNAKRKEKGTWGKIEAVKWKIQRELELRKTDIGSSGFEWIFHTDIDTYIWNPHVSVEAMIPPVAEKRPYMLISKDFDNLNAGVMFFRVDQRSVDMLDQLLSFPRVRMSRPDPVVWKEQAALIRINKASRLEERGDMAVLPQHWFNSYAGMNVWPGAFEHDQHKAPFQLHFPSKWFKRVVMLPFLRELREDNRTIEERILESDKKALTEEMRQFWKDWQPPLHQDGRLVTNTES